MKGGDERPWLAVRIEPSGDPRLVIDVLFAEGSLGVQEEGGAIITYFPPDIAASDIESAVKDADPGATVTTAAAPRADWSEWRASVRAHRLGRLTITPPWLATDDEDSMQVVIDPAMAFGTGEHATTRGVIRLMQKVASMPRVVADLGAGSAVLSICAAKLGASRVVAIELDADAIGNAQQNVKFNGVGAVVSVLQGDAAVLLPLIAPVGLVLANIISSVLLELLPVIRESLAADGRAILSGILVEERAIMSEAIVRSGWEILSEDLEEGWWSVLIARPR